MLDLVYLALVAAPLTLAMTALLLIAIRSFRGDPDQRSARRRIEPERTESPGTAAVPDAPAAGRSALAVPAEDPPPREPPGVEELTALVASLAYPPRALRRESAKPRPRVGAPAAETKICPDCAEQILAAARVCKHCRCRFDEPGDARISA